MQPDRQTAAFADGMQALQQQYCARLQQRADTIRALVLEAPQSREAYLELVNVAHKLAGTGTTYGFARISAAARTLENLLTDTQPPTMEQLKAAAAQLASICEQYYQPVAVPVAQALAAPVLPAAQTLPVLLVVDDDESIHTLIQTLIGHAAHIITAMDGESALHIITGQQPDMIVLDDAMPGAISGMELLEKLQKMPALANVPMMMLTANTAPDAMMRSLVAGVVDYITKPVVPDVLQQKMLIRLQRLQITVLVVDDDETVRQLLCHKFQAAGCKTMAMADGNRAWQYLTTAPAPGIVVLDRMLPAIDGLTLLQMMQRDERLADIPVVFLTARNREENIMEGLNTGAIEYITKPFNPQEVVTRCLRLVEKRAGKQR